MPESPNIQPNYNREADFSKGSSVNIAPLEPFKPYSSFQPGATDPSQAPTAESVLDQLVANLGKTTAAKNPFFASTELTTPIKTPLAQTMRYDDPVYGFDPYNPNLEYQYGDRQSAFSKWTNNLLKFGATAVGTFAETMLTIPMAIKAATEGDLSKTYNNVISNAITDWTDGLEESLPNYQTTFGANHPVLDWIPFLGHTGDSWGGLLKNLGFTVGAIGGAVAQDAIIGLATGGIGELPLIPLQMERIFGHLGKIYASKGGAIKLAQALSTAENVEEAVTATAKSLRTLDRFRYGTSLFTSALGEAIFEANRVDKEIHKSLYDDFYGKYGRDPFEKEQAVINDYAKGGANADLLLNTGLLMLTNSLTMGTILKPMGMTAKTVEAEVVEGAKVAAKGINEVERVGATLPKYMKIFTEPVRILRTSGIEGFEEGSQFAIQTGSEDYYKRKFDNPSMDDVDNLSKSIAVGIRDTLTTREGLENVFLGIMSGAVIHGGKRVLEHFNGVHANKEALMGSLVAQMNTTRLGGDVLADRYGDAVTSYTIAEDMKKAVKTGNIFEYKNLQFKQLFTWINSSLRSNAFEVRMDQLRQAAELPQSEFEKLWGIDDSVTNRKTAREYVDSVIRKAEQIKKNRESVDRVFQNPHERNAKDPQESINYLAYEDYKTDLTLGISELENNKKRVNDIKGDIHRIAPLVDAQKVIDLTHDKGLETTTKELQDRLKSVQDSIELLKSDKESQSYKDAVNERAFINQKLRQLQSHKENFTLDVQHAAELMTYWAHGINPKVEDQMSQLDAYHMLNLGLDGAQLGSEINRTAHRYQSLLTKKGYEDFVEKAAGEYIQQAVKAASQMNPANPAVTDPEVEQIDSNGNVLRPAKAKAEEKKKKEKEKQGKKLTPEQQRVQDHQAKVEAEKQIAKEKENAEKAKKEFEAKKAELEKAKAAPAADAAVQVPEIQKLEQEVQALETEAQQAEQKLKDAEKQAPVILSTTDANSTVDISEIEDPENQQAKQAAEDSKKGVLKNSLYEGVNPQYLLFGLYSNNFKDAKEKDNLQEALFSNTPSELWNKITIQVKEATKGKKPGEFTHIPGTKISREGFAYDIDLVVDGKVIGKMHLLNSLHFEKDGVMTPLSQITQEDYEKVTGNDLSTYGMFIEDINTYEAMVGPIQNAFKEGKTSFSNEEVKRLIDIVPSYGKIEFSDHSNSSTLIKDVTHTGTSAVVSLPMIYDAESGTMQRAETPTILNHKELSVEDQAAITDYIAKNLSGIHKLNARYLYITQLPDGSWRHVVARPAESSQEQLQTLVDKMKAVNASPTAEKARQLNLILRDAIYITDVNARKGQGSQIFFSLDKDGKAFINIYNDKLDEYVNYRLQLKDFDKVRNPQDLVDLANRTIQQKKTLNPSLSRLGVKLDVKDLKTSIPDDGYATMAKLADRLKISAPANIFNNGKLFLAPVGKGRANENPAEQAGARPSPKPKSNLNRRDQQLLDIVSANIGDVKGVTGEGLQKWLQDPSLHQEVVDYVVGKFAEAPLTSQAVFGQAITEAAIKLAGGRLLTDKKSTALVMQEVFGLPVEQAKAVAEIYNRIAKVWAERNEASVEDFYKQLIIMKGNKDRLPESALHQLDEQDGDQEIWNIIRSGRLIGEDPVVEKVARERFDLSELKLISKGGSDRDVYALPDGQVLKVAKSARGLRQNSFEGDPELEKAGTIPKLYERGLNYVVVERVEPLTTFADNEKLDRMLTAFVMLENKMANNTDTNAVYGYSDSFNSILKRYGFGALVGRDMLWGDFRNNPANWGQRADGSLVHLDAGTFAGTDLIIDYMQKVGREGSMKDEDFRRYYALSKKAAIIFGDKLQDVGDLMYQEDEAEDKAPAVSVVNVLSTGKDIVNSMKDEAPYFSAYLDAALDIVKDHLYASATPVELLNSTFATLEDRQINPDNILLALSVLLKGYKSGEFDIAPIGNWVPFVEGRLRAEDAGSEFQPGMNISDIERRKARVKELYEKGEYAPASEGIARERRHQLNMGRATFGQQPYLNQKARAAIQMGTDGGAVIYALTNPNVSSPLHEIAHFFEKSLTLKEQMEVLKWAGHDDWTVETSEKFARGFEAYLAEGKAPSKALQSIFDLFKQWLTEIYKGLVGSDIDVELNDGMRKIYDTMLGKNYKEVAKAAVKQEKKTETKTPTLPVVTSKPSELHKDTSKQSKPAESKPAEKKAAAKPAESKPAVAAKTESKKTNFSSMSAVDYAARLEGMSQEERDQVDFFENSAGYNLFEARQTMPTTQNSLKFKKVSEKDGLLSQDYEYIANVEGIPFGLNKYEDPDNPDDEKAFVWAFERLDQPGPDATVETMTADNKEVMDEMRQSLKGPKMNAVVEDETDGQYQPLEETSQPSVDFTEEEINNYKGEIAKLEARAEKARAAGNTERADDIQQEIDSIKTLMGIEVKPAPVEEVKPAEVTEQPKLIDSIFEDAGVNSEEPAIQTSFEAGDKAIFQGKEVFVSEVTTTKAGNTFITITDGTRNGERITTPDKLEKVEPEITPIEEIPVSERYLPFDENSLPGDRALDKQEHEIKEGEQAVLNGEIVEVLKVEAKKPTIRTGAIIEEGSGKRRVDYSELTPGKSGKIEKGKVAKYQGTNVKVLEIEEQEQDHQETATILKQDGTKLEVNTFSLQPHVSEQDEDNLLVSMVGVKRILNHLQAQFNIPYKLVLDDGKWKGRFVDGVVVINMKNVQRDTPFHEYLHPFIAVLKIDNPEVYKGLVAELSTLEIGKEIMKSVALSPVYAGRSESDKMDEALVRYISMLSARNVNREGLRVRSEETNFRMKELVRLFKDWLNQIWVTLSRNWGGMDRRRMSLKRYSDAEIHEVLKRKQSLAQKEAKGSATPEELEELDSIDAKIPISFLSSSHGKYSGGAYEGNKPLNLNEDGVQDVSLQDIADMVSLTDIAFDLSAHSELLKTMDELQDDSNMDEFVTSKLKQLRGRLDTLRDTAERRIRSEALEAEAAFAAKALNDENPTRALLNYVDTGVRGVDYANKMFSEITGKLKGEAGKLSKDEVNRIAKDLEVVKNILSFYVDDVQKVLSGLGDEFDRDERDGINDILVRANRNISNIQHRSIDILVEWMYPSVENLNNRLQADHPEYVVSKDQFRKMMYSAETDIDRMFFLLGSVGSSRDLVSATVRDILYDVVEDNKYFDAELGNTIKTTYGKWLQKTGIANDRKATAEYYKQNYLRKATNLEIVSWKNDPEDPSGKHKVPVYDYVERWAFHQPYNYDQWQKEFTAYTESLGERPDFADRKAYTAWVTKLEEWQKVNGTLTQPAERFANAEFSKLHGKDEMFTTLYDAYMAGNEGLVETERLPFGIVPQVSQGKNLFSDIKGLTAQHIFGKAWNFILPKLDEHSYAGYETNLDGSSHRSIKLPYMRMLEESDLDLALPETILKFGASMNLTKLMREIEPNVRILKSTLEGVPSLKIEARKILKTTSKREPFFQKFGRKMPVPQEQMQNRINQQLTQFINHAFYGDSEIAAHFQLGPRTVDLNQWGNNMSFLTALNNMVGNVTAAFANVTIGNIQSFGEAIGGKYYNKEHWAKAQARYAQSVPEFIADSARLKKSKITQLGIHYDAIQGEFRDKFGKRFVGNVAQKYATQDTLFILTHAGEHQIQLTGMLAFMEATKVKLQDGTEMSLYDAYEVNDKGFLKLRPDAVWSEQDEKNFTKRLHALNQLLNGNYSTFDKAYLSYTWYGKLALIYRKYLYNAFRNRYGGQRTDMALGDVTKGYYNQFFSKLAKDTIAYKSQVFTKSTWSADEKYAASKTLYELALFTGITMLGIAIAGGEDKKKKKEPWIASYFTLLLLRTRNDVGQYTVFGVQDVARMIQNPTAISLTLTRYAQFFTQLITDPFEHYKRKTGYFDKGDSVLKAKFLKSLPFARQFINLMSPAEQQKFYQLLNKNF